MSDLVLIEEAEDQTSPGLCPCCHERQALPGLYSRVKISNHPAVFGLLSNSGTEFMVQKLNEEVWMIFGRYYLQAYAGLPLARRNSPIRIATWVEVEQLTAHRVVEAMSGYGDAVESAGRLAVDLPGFPGSLGVETTFQVFPGDYPELIHCEDRRMLAIPHDLDHDRMAALYRLVWGNPDPVLDADLTLRAAVNRHWHDHLERPFYRRAVTPPPVLAGIRPPELLVSPPIDTDEPALLATVGCSEHPDSYGELIELITEVRDPSEEYIDSFSRFTWFSRTSNGPFGAGVAMVPMGGLPGAREEMIGWLLTDPRSLPEEAWRITHEGRTVRVLEAIPVDQSEVALLQSEDADALTSLLEGIDTTDLGRDSVSPLADL